SARVGIAETDAFANSDPTELGRWLEAQIGHPVEIPAISNAILIGGRVADISGQPAASASYLIEGNALTYFALPAAEIPSALPAEGWVHMMSSEEFNIVTWKVAGSVRALVARMGKRELVALAQECRRMASTSN
ncbi:MAG: hypothetical protein JSW71_20650, partial [Gemmatimonadota bacterium]